MSSTVRVATFSWNLDEEPAHLTRAAQHLAELLPSGEPFVACLQELPAVGAIPTARRTGDPQPPTYRVVQTDRFVPGCAIVHHPSLEFVDAVGDVDNEFLAARFKLGSFSLRVVCVHAESQLKLKDAQARSGARALLRNALARLERADYILLMGDFNSHYAEREISSYNTFYAINPLAFPSNEPSKAARRGVPHPAWHVVVPNNPRPMGTYRFQDQFHCMDFMVVSEGLAPTATCTILTEIVREQAFDANDNKLLLSDHLPIAGSVTIPS